jgi:hypothetical protein
VTIVVCAEARLEASRIARRKVGMRTLERIDFMVSSHKLV